MGELVYSKLIELSKGLFNFLVFNVIWFVLNFPLTALLIQIALATERTSYDILIPLTILLLPVVFFPSTQALISTMRETIIKDDLLNIKVFFTFYKTSFKTSLLAGILFTGLLTFLAGLLVAGWYHSILFFTLIIVLLFYLGMIILHFFFFEAHFNMPFYWKLKQDVMFVSAYPIRSILNIFLVILLQFILWSITPILFIVLGMAISSYFTFYLFMKKYAVIAKQSNQS